MTLPMEKNDCTEEDAFLYSPRDFHFSTNSKHDRLERSDFDNLLLSQWDAAMSAGVFKYSVEGVKTKVLPGKYHIVVQMNSHRKIFRRTPEAIVDVEQPFEADKFNFTKIKKEEQLLKLVYVPDSLKVIDSTEVNGKREPGGGSLVINNAPICSSHSLLVPSPAQCLKQVVTCDGLTLALHSLLLSHSPDLRVAYNSLGGYASVNHFHFHIYYLPYKLYIETVDCVHLAGPCYTFKDFYAPGFVFQLENGDVDQLARRVMKIVTLFLGDKVAHNLYITRGTNLEGKEAGEEYDTLRVIIWARKFVSGVKDITGLSAAACELASHVPVYSQDDWNTLAEEDITQTIHSVCLEFYQAMRSKVVSLFCDDDDGVDGV